MSNINKIKTYGKICIRSIKTYGPREWFEL